MTDEELLRYSRHILLPEFGLAGQMRLKRAHVLLVGLGGLGSPVALYLAAAGVGRLTLADFDTVDLANLQRQVLYRTADLGTAKADSARAAVLALNPGIEIITLSQRLDEDMLADHVATADVVVDASDNLPTRLAINAACVRAQTPLVSGAVIRLEGQVLVWQPGGEGGCYRCLYRVSTAPTETCVESGVLGPVVGVIGSLQALETIKLLAGLGESLAGRLLIFDALRMEWQTLTIRRWAECPVCGMWPVNRNTKINSVTLE